jgi:hypothetical protein
MQQLSANVFVETGFKGSNNTFVVTAEGVVMIDARNPRRRQGKSPAEILSSLSFAARYPPPSPPPSADCDNLTRLVRILSGSRID